MSTRIQSAQPQFFGALNAAFTSPSSHMSPRSMPAKASTYYAAMPNMTPVLAQLAGTSPVFAVSSTLATISTKWGGSGSGFDDRWMISLGSAGVREPAGGSASVKSIRDLEKAKAQAGIWGTQNQMRLPAAAASSGGGSGSFVKSTVASSSGGGALTGVDDLLLL